MTGSSAVAPRVMVASADRLATEAGLRAFALGGNAIDAAIATNAAIAVTGPHLCGMGGDLFALVHHQGEVFCLNASGRAGTGASSATLRADGHSFMPMRHDIRAVTVPGCVDGWHALHQRFGTLPLATLLAPAIELAGDGFPASPLLVAAIGNLDDRGRLALHELVDQATAVDARVRRAGVARTLEAIARQGRDAFYRGEFGDGLLQLGEGWFTEADLATPGAEWVASLSLDVFGTTLWTVPPNSQGYLLLAAARIAELIGIPSDSASDAWVHVLAEAAKLAACDRPQVLHEAADGSALVRAAVDRADRYDATQACAWPVPANDGDTTYLCTADGDGNGVSLIQSNASGFGSWVVEPNTGINLHNRGLGFSLSAGHPAELRPGARPPHTLAPALATSEGELSAVFGTMGGDAQPQILLQLAARLFIHRQSPEQAVNAPRWAWVGPLTGFDTWTAPQGPTLTMEAGAAGWPEGARARGHRVVIRPDLDGSFGHAHVIMRHEHGWAGAADPRARIGAAVGA